MKKQGTTQTKNQTRVSTKETPIKAKMQHSQHKHKLINTTKICKVPILQKHPAYKKANLQLSNMHKFKPKHTPETSPKPSQN